MHYALIAIMALILLRCAFSLLFSGSKDEVWGTLVDKKGTSYDLTHWENLIGRSSGADVRLKSKTASPVHAALVRDNEGNWTVSDLGSREGTILRGKIITKRQRINSGDTLTIGGTELKFTRSTKKMEENLEATREDASKSTGAWQCMMLLSAFICILALELLQNLEAALKVNILFAFVSVLILAWGTFIMTVSARRRGFELETIAFLLTSVGFAVCLSSDAKNIFKLGICLAIGVVLYFAMCWFLRDQKRVNLLRVPIAVLGLVLLGINLASASTLLGAKNWLNIGGVSFQPSEIVKIAFVFAGSVGLERIFSKGNVVLFMAFSAVCIGCLAFMRDFGTALIFFTVYLVIAFMRSGSFATVFMSALGALLAAVIAITARPYIADRFAVWGHAWEDAANLGYQQTRTMTAVASGGLFGLGGGKGWFKSIFAADTDMVFGVVGEEYGFIIAALCVLFIAFLGFTAVKSVKNSRSSFYAIAACAAASFYLAGLILNVFGSVDILPFTGVTFPFVSKGGTSLIASWGMLSFLKAADTRPMASFAVLPPGTRAKKKRKPKKEAPDEEA
ncbi:MAG: FtsW/RodA/SpoVE family cell cycle protein [Oscillospiraceae bacterium]|nr:FtsW/RodA/SpoVE family cell cycle protein [Oscillospiraceae bacterium]